jgi:hypothetical protein
MRVGTVKFGMRLGDSSVFCQVVHGAATTHPDRQEGVSWGKAGHWLKVFMFSG